MTILALVFCGLWGLLCLVALTNLLLMPKPMPGSSREDDKALLTALIPARNEEGNLELLLPALVPQFDQVIIYDDSSDDATAAVAKKHGAMVIQGTSLPSGWTGKNHACWQLAKVASEVSPSKWWVFLDADLRVQPTFGGALRSLIRQVGSRTPVLTGFPKLIPGAGLEPLYMLWVPWMLLCSIPFGLIQRSRTGHSRFTNGQIVIWEASRYWEINPHETCKSDVLEDVQIGRLLARQKVPTTVARLTHCVSVAMYRTLGEAWSGMTKNSYWITGSTLGAILLGTFLAVGALIWLAFPMPYLALMVGMILFTSALTTILAGMPLWIIPFLPISILAAAVTQFHALRKVRTTGVTWKGRTYSETGAVSKRGDKSEG